MKQVARHFCAVVVPDAPPLLRATLAVVVRIKQSTPHTLHGNTTDLHPRCPPRGRVRSAPFPPHQRLRCERPGPARSPRPPLLPRDGGLGCIHDPAPHRARRRRLRPFDRTPLSIASETGNGAAIQLLIENGADTTAACTGGLSFLHVATRHGHADAARVLVDNGADVDATSPGDSCTPLHYACAVGHADVVQVLLQFGARTEARDHLGRSPLHIAAMMGAHDSALALLEHGALLDTEDIFQKTPLRAALLGSHTLVARLLVEHGADTIPQEPLSLSFL